MVLKRWFTQLTALAVLVILLSSHSASLTWAKSPTVLIVDAGQGPFFTIQEALDAAATIQGEVEIHVAPGTHFGQVVIDRPNTKLVGLSRPQHDPDGFLTGFAAPVIVQNVTPLAACESIIWIRASRVTVEGLTVIKVDGSSKWSGAIGASGHKQGDEGEEILRHVVIRNNWLVANVGIALAAQAAGVQVEQNRSEDGGVYGLVAQGGDDALGPTPRVAARRNHFENKEFGVFLSASVWECAEGSSHGPASLAVDLRNNRILGSVYANVGVIFRGGAWGAPSGEAALELHAHDNWLGEPAEIDLVIHGGGQNAAQGAGPGRMAIHWLGNERLAAGAQPPGPLTARISFKPDANSAAGLYVQDSTIILVDPKRSLAAIEPDLGSPEDRNTFKRVPPLSP